MYCLMDHHEKKEDFWTKYHITGLLQLFATIGVIYLVIFIPNHSDYVGKGSVNLFPKGAASKNYRLDADIHVIDNSMGRFNLNNNISYTLNSVDWPNGGHSHFDKCYLFNVGTGLTDTCKDTEGRSYEVELNAPPIQ